MAIAQQGRNNATQQTSFIRVDITSKDDNTVYNTNSQLPAGAIVIRAGVFIVEGFDAPNGGSGSGGGSGAGAGETVTFAIGYEDPKTLATGSLASTVGHTEMTLEASNGFITEDNWVVVNRPAAKASEKGKAVLYLEFIQPR